MIVMYMFRLDARPSRLINQTPVAKPCGPVVQPDGRPVQPCLEAGEKSVCYPLHLRRCTVNLSPLCTKLKERDK